MGTDTTREESFLLGKMLEDNALIEQIARSISADELLPARAGIFDLICRLWVKEPKKPIRADAIFYAATTIAHLSPEDAKVWSAVAMACVETARANTMTLDQVIAIIHKARLQDRISELNGDFQKHQTNWVNEIALAVMDEIRDLAVHGIKVPKFEALSKMMTDPPLYELTVNMHGDRHVLRMTDSQLRDPKQVEGKVWQHFDCFPDFMPGSGQWKLVLSRLARGMDRRIVDHDRPAELVAVDRAEIDEYLREYLDHAKRVKKVSEMVPRTVYEQEDNGNIGVNFRDLQNYIRQKGIQPSNQRLSEVLVKHGFRWTRVGFDRTRLWIKQEELL